MGAGERNRQIVFRQKTISYGTYNEPIPDWSDAFTVWAKVITTGGKEFYAAQKLYAETSAVFDVRYTQRIHSRLRIKYGNRTLEILGLNDVDGKHESILVSAKEVI
jgi:SPP1 family predicted phage head-tail adaptor